MKQIAMLLPWLCSFALLGAVGCAAEAGETEASDSNAAATAEQAETQTWVAGSQGGKYWDEGTANYIGMDVRRGSIVEGVAFYHTDERLDGHWTDWRSNDGNNYYSGGVVQNCDWTNGKYMVGIRGKAGWLVDAVGPICGRYDRTDDNALSYPPGYTEGSGGTAFGTNADDYDRKKYNIHQLCPTGQIVRRVVVRVGGLMDNIWISCGPYYDYMNHKFYPW